jgi:hypothetical protein
MKRMYKKIVMLALLLGMGFSLVAVAQSSNLAAAKKLLAGLQQTYHTNNLLSFDVQYTYTNESRPDSVLDSLSGRLTLLGDNYRYAIDRMVTVKNDRYTILLFEADKLMYLSRPQTTASADPVRMLDSLLKSTPGMQVSIGEQKQVKKLQLRMPAGLQYKTVEMAIDKQSGYLTGITYLVKTDALVNPAERHGNAEAEGYEAYARVTARFSHYQTAAADSALFNEAAFFTRNGKTFTPVDQYKDYKIFLGSPNL